MSDERLDKLGEYYIYFDIGKRYGIPFWRFLEMVERNVWISTVK